MSLFDWFAPPPPPPPPFPSVPPFLLPLLFVLIVIWVVGLIVSKFEELTREAVIPEAQNGHCVRTPHECCMETASLLALSRRKKQHVEPCPLVEESKQPINMEICEEKQSAAIKDRNALLYNNHFLSDVEFVLDYLQPESETLDSDCTSQAKTTTTVIVAHRHVLAAASSVFNAMFFGSLPEKQMQIRVTDISVEGFLHMLR
jgi:hypothetical protein